MSHPQSKFDCHLPNLQPTPPTNPAVMNVQTHTCIHDNPSIADFHGSTHDNPSGFGLMHGARPAMDTETRKEVITVLVADDHPVVREGLVSLINRRPELRVIAQASNGREAIDQFMALRPDVGLLDLRMPSMDGAEAIGAICEREPTAHLVVVTTFDSEEDIYRALRAGAHGYILKDATIDELVTCIREVGAGRTWIPPAVGAKLARRVSDRRLTKREMEVLRAVAAGKSNKEVGSAFNISEATVKVHVTHILEKLKVSGRTEAINVAARRGLVRLDGAPAVHQH